MLSPRFPRTAAALCECAFECSCRSSAPKAEDWFLTYLREVRVGAARAGAAFGAARAAGQTPAGSVPDFVRDGLDLRHWSSYDDLEEAVAAVVWLRAYAKSHPAKGQAARRKAEAFVNRIRTLRAPAAEHNAVLALQLLAGG